MNVAWPVAACPAGSVILTPVQSKGKGLPHHSLAVVSLARQCPFLLSRVCSVCKIQPEANPFVSDVLIA